MSIGGPGPMYTAKAFAAPRVTRDLLREWGEAVWTAVDLVEREFGNRLETEALRGPYPRADIATEGGRVAEVTEEQFKDAVEEVVGHLGVAILTVATGTEAGAVREAWRTFGRGLAELLDMEPPR